MKRIFIGINIQLKPELKKSVELLKEDLKAEKIRWVSDEKLHLTLMFLGDISDEDITMVKDVLAKKSKEFSPFFLMLHGLSYFKHRGKPNVVLVQVSHSEKLADLVAYLRDSLRHIVFQKNDKEFNPHLTLARMKNLKRPDQFYEVIRNPRKVVHQAVAVSEFVLYESILTPSGAFYGVLQKFPLA